MRGLTVLAICLALVLSGCLAGVASDSKNPRSRNGVKPGGTLAPTPIALPAKTSWKKLPDSQVPRAEHCAANVAAKFYVIGGLIVPNPVSFPGPAGSVPAAAPTPRVDIYDAAANTIVQGPDYPVNLDHCLAIGYNGWIYVFTTGGSNKLKPEDNKWVSIASPPHSHNAGVVDEIDGKFYAVGGGSPLVDAYDPAANTWTTFPNQMPTSRGHTSGAAVNGRLYVIGGDLKGGHGDNTAANEIFDPLTGQWSNGSALPVVRGSLHAFPWFGHIVVMGGQNGQTNVPAFGDVNVYDPIADTWSVLPKMSEPRHGFAGGVWNSKIYVFEGAPQQGVSSFAANDVMSPE